MGVGGGFEAILLPLSVDSLMFEVGTFHSCCCCFFPTGWICAVDLQKTSLPPHVKSSVHVRIAVVNALTQAFRINSRAFLEDFCQLMIIESRTMASSDEEEQLGTESEDEGELSDGQVSSS